MAAGPAGGLAGAAAGVSLLGAAVLHAGPALSAVGPLRRRLLPALAGLGDAAHVALTFDDGPDPASTPMFLDALADLGWRATFFMLGDMARRCPSLAAEVAAAGHEVALHGDDHRSHLWRTPRSVADDVRRGLDSVTQTTGAVPVWWRPPYGVITSGGLRASRQAGLRPVLWTTWGRDWRAEATPDTVMADVETDLVPGATVLLHDSDCTSAPGAWRAGLVALPLMAESFRQLGCEVGPLAEHGLDWSTAPGPACWLSS